MYEKSFFPDTEDLGSYVEKVPENPRGYFFCGSPLEIQISEFLKPDIFDLFPNSSKYWDNEIF